MPTSRPNLLMALFCGFTIASHAHAQDNAAPIVETHIPVADKAPQLVVVVEGIEGAPKENILAALEMQHFHGQPLAEETPLHILHAQAEAQIREALQPFGYYAPTVTATLVRNEKEWHATYHVQPGKPLPIATVTVRIDGEGQQDAAFQALLAHVPVVQGKTLEHTQYEQLKSGLETLATERGYFDARFVESTVQVDLQSYQAVVRVQYDTGKRYHFGPITFSETMLSPKKLRRYLHFKAGDPYLADDLVKLQGDLNGTPYFRNVQVNAPPDPTTKTAPVSIELEANVLHKHSASVGYGTDTGARTRFRTEQHWVNTHGHHYESELQWSAIKSQLGLKYLIPGTDPTTDEYALTVGYTEQHEDDQEYQQTALGASFQQQSGRLLKRYGLTAQYEDFQVGDQSLQHTFLFMPSAQSTWVYADDRLYPRRGLSADVEIRGATQALLSDLDFMQATLRVKGVYALTDTSRFIARGDWGATFIRQPFAELPSSLRFLSGGDTSVRGYAHNSIGPIDSSGVVVGGKNLAVGSLEYEHKLWNDWSAATFIDSGDAFDGTSPAFKTGAGVGLRWRSPVGPVRIDVATGLDQPPGDPFRFSLTIGPDL